MMADLESLIDRWRAGDQKAAEAIYNLHRDRTFRLAFALLDNHQDAEEAAQDALAYALQNIDRFDEKRSKFTTWLHMVTVSRSRDILRKRRPLAVSLGQRMFWGFRPVDLSPGPQEKIELEGTRGAVWQAVQDLNPLLREAIVLRYWGGHTYREMSEILGCPMKTAQSRVRLAHERLGREFDAQDLPHFLEEAK